MLRYIFIRSGLAYYYIVNRKAGKQWCCRIGMSCRIYYINRYPYMHMWLTIQRRISRFFCLPASPLLYLLPIALISYRSFPVSGLVLVPLVWSYHLKKYSVLRNHSEEMNILQNEGSSSVEQESV